MTLEERLALLEGRLAAAEARIAQLEAPEAFKSESPRRPVQTSRVVPLSTGSGPGAYSMTFTGPTVRANQAVRARAAVQDSGNAEPGETELLPSIEIDETDDPDWRPGDQISLLMRSVSHPTDKERMP